MLYLPSYHYYESDDENYIAVQGTIVSTIPGSKVAFPLNTNDFVCDKIEGNCRLVQSEIHEFSGAYSLSSFTQTFDIESWDRNFIVFKVNSGCIFWTYRIDRIKQELVGLRRLSGDYSSEDCRGYESEFAIKLTDGWEVISKLRGYE